MLLLIKVNHFSSSSSSTVVVFSQIYFFFFSRPFSNSSMWRMCLGKHHMNSSADVPSAEQCYPVDGIIIHEGFVYEEDSSDISNDIALVHLTKPVNMTREISPICLPRLGAVMPAGTACFVTGWGDEKGRSLGVGMTGVMCLFFY